MTFQKLLEVAEINHTKTNCYNEHVYNVTIQQENKSIILDLIEVGNQIMQLVGVENTRVPFIINQSN